MTGREWKEVARSGPDLPSAMVLAAGASSRFGGVKQSARIGGSSLLERVVESIPPDQVREVVVVLGFQADELSRILAPRKDVRVVINRDYPKGMSTSIAKGVRSLTEDAAGVLLLLADQPFVTRSFLRRMLRAFSDSGSQKIVAASDGDLVSPPVIFPRRFFGELQFLEGDKGANSVITRHASDLLRVAVGKSRSLVDIDTQEEFAAARRLLDS